MPTRPETASLTLVDADITSPQKARGGPLTDPVAGRQQRRKSKVAPDMDDATACAPGGLRMAQPQLAEIFGGSRDAGAVAFALTQIPAGKPVLWVQDRLSARELGQPYGPALRRFGLDPDGLMVVSARRPVDVLWAMEEGLACPALGAVIGEVWGDARAADFTASKRLAMRAERTGIHAVLLRFAAREGLSAARRRWRVASAPSAGHPHDPRAPGRPLWRADLFRARDTRPGTWEAGYEPKTHRLHVAAAFRDPALAAAAV